MKKKEREIVTAIHQTSGKLANATNYAEEYIYRREMIQAIKALQKYIEEGLAKARA